MSSAILPAAPLPAGVRAFTTLRHGAGASAAPFDTFNLGNFRDVAGDDPAVVASNRAELVARFGLPSWPHWLRQVHGTRVLRFEEAGRPPPQPSPAGGGGSWTPATAASRGEERPDPPHSSRRGEGRHGHGVSAASRFPPSLAGEGSDWQREFAAPGLHPTRDGGGSDAQHETAASRLPPSPAVEGRDAQHESAASLPPPLAGEGWGGGASGAPGVSASAHPPNAPDEPEADAAVTSTPGVVLAILTADCLPVVFAARDGSELAAAHAGWPGLSAGMLEATLAAMRTAPADVVAWIGPCAGPARYEVGRNVFEAFVGPDPGAAAAFAPTREGHWLADLPALARRRLTAAGMRQADIHGGELCTISDPDRFFSHRRDGRSGRIATLAWIGDAPGRLLDPS